MTQAKGFDWYVAIDDKPIGPVSAQDLAQLVLQRKVRADDLVWCEGLPDWLPVGLVLGATEQASGKPMTHTVHVEAADRRQTALRVASLARLYVEKLAELTHTAGRPIFSAAMVEAASMGMRRSPPPAQPMNFATAAAHELASLSPRSSEPSTGRLEPDDEVIQVQAIAEAMWPAGALTAPARLIERDRVVRTPLPS